jgi:peptidoglycan/LPS O-acetylase OafA/YrhL
LADWWTIAHAGGVSHETLERFTFAGFLRNLFLLQVPSFSLPFGSDAALWSVAIEFWIYLLAGIIAFTYRDGISAARALFILLFAVVPLQCLTRNNAVLVPWIMGAATEIAINRGLLKKLSPAKALAIGAAAISVYAFRLYEGKGTYNLLSYAALAIAFAAMIETALRTAPAINPSFIGWCAGWSYSLYLLHHTIILDVADLRYDVWGFAAAMAGSIVFSIGFAEATEKHHRRIAGLIKAKLPTGKPQIIRTM